MAPVLLDDEFDFAAPEVQMFFLQLCEGLLKGTPLLEQQNAGRTCFGTGFRNYAMGTSYARFPLPREAFPHALHTFANGYHSWAKGTMGFAPPRNPEAEPAADGGTTPAPQPLARGNTAMVGGNLTWLAVKLTAAFDSRAPSSILEQVSVLQCGVRVSSLTLPILAQVYADWEQALEAINRAAPKGARGAVQTSSSWARMSVEGEFISGIVYAIAIASLCTFLAVFLFVRSLKVGVVQRALTRTALL